ncbi:MAG: hypothetical protein GX285_09360 [Clostridiales bacterium]|nr:hypothetical protein [Clostridiales bacterium]
MKEKRDNGVTYERRKGPDVFNQSVRWISIIGWFIFIFSILLIREAAPQNETFLDRFYNASVRTHWNDALLVCSFVFMLILTILCFYAFICNLKRRRRATDKLSYSIIILGIISIIGIIVFGFTLF